MPAKIRSHCISGISILLREGLVWSSSFMLFLCLIGSYIPLDKGHQDPTTSWPAEIAATGSVHPLHHRSQLWSLFSITVLDIIEKAGMSPLLHPYKVSGFPLDQLRPPGCLMLFLYVERSCPGETRPGHLGYMLCWYSSELMSPVSTWRLEACSACSAAKAAGGKWI